KSARLRYFSIRHLNRPLSASRTNCIRPLYQASKPLYEPGRPKSTRLFNTRVELRIELKTQVRVVDGSETLPREV
ncbi:uncharacterized protein BDZ99DRAFT_466613, partial [Mytilinidion resinicola]